MCGMVDEASARFLAAGWLASGKTYSIAGSKELDLGGLMG